MCPHNDRVILLRFSPPPLFATPNETNFTSGKSLGLSGNAVQDLLLNMISGQRPLEHTTMPARRPPKKVPRAGGRLSRPTSAPPSTPVSEAGNGCDNEIAEIPIQALTLSDVAEARPKIAPKKKHKPFRFMALPSELRIEIYACHFRGTGWVIDLDSDNYKRIHQKLAILRTCRAIYQEASHVFYSTRTFRIFPTQPGRFFKTKKPLLARLKTRQRLSLTSLELRFGPGWNSPPRGWVVNPALGLAECVNVRELTVFVQCDPSDNIYTGWRKADGFYEAFSRDLLDQVLAEMPFVGRVYFDAWPGVKESGAMMTGLLEVAKARGRTICWGPEWRDREESAVAHMGTAIGLINNLELHPGCRPETGSSV